VSIASTVATVTPALGGCEAALLLRALERAERPKHPNFDAIGFRIRTFACLGPLALAVVVHNENNGEPVGTHRSEALFRFSDDWVELVRSGPDLSAEQASPFGVTAAQLQALRRLQQ
jgi:hypothetical protein